MTFLITVFQLVNHPHWKLLSELLYRHTLPVLRSHRSSSMAIAVPWGPSMAINGPSMDIDEVFLTLIPSMTHRWKSKFSITKIRSTWPCSKFQRNSGHLSFSFSLFKLCLGFRGCPNILFRNEVIHSYPYYLPL